MQDEQTDFPTKLNYIDGEWRDSTELKPSVNPATGEEIGYYYEAPRSDVNDAINSAYNQFHNSDWKDNRQLRAQVLSELATKIEEHEEELVRLICQENGKKLADAQLEFSFVPSKIRYYAAITLIEEGGSGEVVKDVYSTLKSQPIGVAGIIAPWNAPLVLAIRALAPALAAGCTCVIKMPAQTAILNGFLAEIIASVESLPAGVINLFTESGDAGAKLLVDAKKVGVISYTGSTLVGEKIIEASAKNFKRLSLELGGKTPLIIFDDANLDEAIATAVAGITTFTGQFCMAGSRILVQKSVAETVQKRLVEALSNIKVGAGEDRDTEMGPLIDPGNAERVDRIVQQAAQSEECEVLVRGGRGKIDAENLQAYDAYYRPSLIAVQNVQSTLIQEEIFGPVATFEIFEGERDLIDRVNATKYGLAVSMWTNDRARSLQLPAKLDAGTVWVNGWAMTYDQFEEGGFKHSGMGRLNGRSAVHEFQEYKHIVQYIN